MPNHSHPAHAKIKIEDVVKHFLPLLRPFRLQLCWAVVAMVLDALLTVLRPWPLKIVIDRVLSHKPTHVPLLAGWLDHASFGRLPILYGACAATLLIALSTGLLTYSYTRVLGDVGQRFVFLLRGDLFAHMQRLSLQFHDRQRIGDLITRLTSDIQAIQDIIANGTILLVSNACLLVGMLALMFWLNWQFALAALSGAPLLLWTIFRYTGRIKAAARAARASDGLLGSIAQETLTSIRIVQGMAQEEQQDEHFQAQSKNSLHAYLEVVRYQAGVAPFVDILAAVGLVVVMWYGATRVLAGALTTGDVVIFFAYVTNLYSPMKALARLSYALNRASVGAERIVEVLRIHREISDRKDARSVSRLRGSIEFRDVSFWYEIGQPVLSHIHLKIAPGEKVAIVGATGEGKSTLVSLIPRLYDPRDGAVYIDGEDLRSYTVQSLREQISLVLQDSLLFSGTIRDNIAFGRSNASDEEIIAAARTANADEFIQQLPRGYETMVSERGTTLSGGQKQRIAIARAILRDTPILILDEPTSGLDAATERKVVEALERAAAGRTTVTITHRLTPLRFTDRTIVLEKGHIVEEGTHTELLRRNGRYVHLLQLAVDRARESIDNAANTDAQAPNIVGMWHRTRHMNIARTRHTETLLANGKTLVAGGLDNTFTATAIAELYDPNTKTWSLTGSMNVARYGHTATLLSNGKVLVVGGAGKGTNELLPAELYDPTTRTWILAGAEVAHLRNITPMSVSPQPRYTRLRDFGAFQVDVATLATQEIQSVSADEMIREIGYCQLTRATDAEY